MAVALNRAGLGTLLVDLLTAGEELSRAYVFNIAMLAGRLTGITRWLRGQPVAATLPFGYFGASTGAAAALWAAAATPQPPVAAVVSRGGRPDVAGRVKRWRQVPAPTADRGSGRPPGHRQAQHGQRCERSDGDGATVFDRRLPGTARDFIGPRSPLEPPQAGAGRWMLVAMTPRAAPQRRARETSPSSSVFCWPIRKLSGAAMRR